VVDNAGTDERVAVTVEINTPGIAGAIGKDFELLSSWMIPSDRCVDFDPGSRSFRNLNAGVREYAMCHIEPAVRPPGEAVQQFMPIMKSEAGEQNCTRICHVIVIGVLQKQKLGCLAYVHSSVA